MAKSIAHRVVLLAIAAAPGGKVCATIQINNNPTAGACVVKCTRST